MISQGTTSLFDTTPVKASSVRSDAAVRQGIAARETALEQVEDGADVRFLALAMKAVEDIAEHSKTFTTDDVWARVGMAAKEPRAMGAVMSKARNKGIIKHADCAPVYSKRPECHRRPLRVWQSLIYRAKVLND